MILDLDKYMGVKYLGSLQHIRNDMNGNLTSQFLVHSVQIHASRSYKRDSLLVQ